MITLYQIYNNKDILNKVLQYFIMPEYEDVCSFYKGRDPFDGDDEYISVVYTISDIRGEFILRLDDIKRNNLIRQINLDKLLEDNE